MTVELSGPQKEAVRYVGGPAIITAGAGSGKTRTLTSKIAYLVSECGYDPAKILAITFTNKAAGEMKSRLQEITGRPPKDFPWVRTFHSACFQILKEHCDRLGYRKPLVIHSDYQQKSDLKKALAKVDLDKKYLGSLASMISMAKNSGNPYQYLAAAGKLPRKREVYDLYNELLMQQNAVDFDDILLLVRDLLDKFPDVRGKYQDLFDYVLVDEFQDSNAIQNQIVDLLLRDGNLTVVGDDYQSIYKFRGADPAHFINFPTKYASAKVFKLEENYRSTTQIVAAADALIAGNANRMEKQCFSTRKGPLILAKSFMSEDDEADWVVTKCWEYKNYSKISYEKMAVLYRTKFCSLAFERAFRLAQVPYRMMGGKGFFERREVQDINAYLISALNVKDEAAFERIVNVPKRGVGPGALKKVLTHKNAETSLQEASWKVVRDKALPKKTGAELQSLLQLLDELRKERPDDAIRRVISETGYEDYLKSYCEGESDFIARQENIQQMIYTASQKGSIADYLEDCALIKEDQDDSDEDDRGVRLSTFHAAKGLEYDVVFVVALEEGLLPHWRSVKAAADESDEFDEDQEGLEEERRLMYVAMTRAAQRLHLTWSRLRKGEPAKRSRFVGEVPSKYLTYGD
jgi:DNA helicase-2/ATP-dependent DNA helicase PcrA